MNRKLLAAIEWRDGSVDLVYEAKPPSDFPEVFTCWPIVWLDDPERKIDLPVVRQGHFFPASPFWN